MWEDKYQHINFSSDRGVLLVRLARPERLNAINARLHTELSWLFRDIAEHSTCRAVVLTGEGKAFSAGGDISWFSEILPDELDRLFVEARRIVVDMLEVPQPIITAINGPAVGLGATLSLLGDVIFMAKSAVVADTHVHAGIAAGDGGAAIWPWIVGMARAKEYLMTGKRITSEMAREVGLVNYVVDDDALLEEASGMARRLADGPQLAIRATKASLNKILRDTVNLNLDTSLALEKECFSSQEHRDLVAAFLARKS